MVKTLVMKQIGLHWCSKHILKANYSQRCVTNKSGNKQTDEPAIKFLNQNSLKTSETNPFRKTVDKPGQNTFGIDPFLWLSQGTTQGSCSLPPTQGSCSLPPGLIMACGPCPCGPPRCNSCTPPCGPCWPYGPCCYPPSGRPPVNPPCPPLRPIPCPPRPVCPCTPCPTPRFPQPHPCYPGCPPPKCPPVGPQPLCLDPRCPPCYPVEPDCSNPCGSCVGRKVKCPPPCCFKGPIAPNPCCPKHPHINSYQKYRSLFFVMIPLIILQALFALGQETCPKGPCREFEYMRIRTKRFPWGDGVKSFFHNEHVNHLPGECEPPPLVCIASEGSCKS